MKLCWKELWARYEIDTIFHVAAQAIVGVANRNPLATFEANIRGTWNVLSGKEKSFNRENSSGIQR